jgi:prepilin-type N-terminal cleavage/methylation domain-containing protein
MGTAAHAQKVKRMSMNEKGLSLVELTVVLAIVVILTGIAGLTGRAWIARYNAESQIRMIQADLLNARMKAMEKNRKCFVLLSAGSCQIIEDTNDNGQRDSAAIDTYQAPRTLSYLMSSDAVTIVMDTRGLITTDPPNTSLSIMFNTSDSQPEYNCMLVLPTRINIGRLNGTTCVPK